MFCGNCSKEIPDDAKFCGHCGAPVVPRAEPAASRKKPAKKERPARKERPAKQEQPVDQEPTFIQAQSDPGPKKRRKWPWVVLICVLCAAAVAAGLWLGLRARGGTAAGPVQEAGTPATPPPAASSEPSPSPSPAPGGTVQVRDGYCYIGSADNGSGERQVMYRFPEVVIPGVSTDAVNASLLPGEGELYWMADMAGRDYIASYDLITYDWSVTGDILSILTVERYDWGTVNYHVDNISVTTGQFITDDEVLAQAGVTRDEFYQRAGRTLHGNFDDYLADYCFGMDELSAFENIETVDKSMPFFNDQGHLSMIAFGAPVTADLPYLFLFDLETEEPFETLGLVTAPVLTGPGGQLPAAEVQDAYTFTDTYVDPYGTSYPVEYHVPEVLLDGEALAGVNDRLWDTLYEQQASYGPPNGQTDFTGLLGMDYQWCVSGNVLSLVVASEWGPEEAGFRYRVLNISLQSGAVLSTEQVLLQAGMTKDEFTASVRDVLNGCLDRLLPADSPSRAYGLEMTMSDDNAARFLPFFREDGDLCALATVYGLSAAGQIDLLLDLQSGQPYGEQAALYGVDGQSADTAQPVPASQETDDGVWEVYDHIVSDPDGQSRRDAQIRLDPSVHRYEVTLGLSELHGAITGTYRENEQGELCCTVETKDIYGASGEDVPTFWLQRQGSSLVPLQDIWSFPSGTEFTYGRRFTVTPTEGAGTVTGNSVRFRSAPSTDDLILFELNKGDVVQITGVVTTDAGETWYRVGYTYEGSASSGYMSGDYVSRQ